MASPVRSPNTPHGPDSLALMKVEPELLLLVFIHGFKGTDETFADFPKRIEHLLSQIVPQQKTEAVIFPAYEDKAVVRFADWLTTLVVEREVASGLGAGKAKVVLCGHSMGGLLAADTLREFVRTRPDKDAPLWPKIVACISFDTPYYGIHPFVVKNSVTKVAQYANAATTVGTALLGSLAGFGAKKATQPAEKESRSASPPPQAAPSSWTAWAGAAAVGGAVLAGAAAGVAYYKKDDLTLGFSWATDHLKYVGNLWDEAGLDQRVEALIDIEKEHGVVFRTLYSLLPPNPPEFLTSRTFVVLPKYGSRAKSHFLPAMNGVTSDEIQGHTGMFAGNTNDGYYQLGLETARIIRDAVLSSRGIVENVPSPSSPRKSRRRTRTRSPTKEKQREDDLIQL
ncbi:hypothetical protein GALMADRAFT_111021 [Galerina marginata CBS 339.88]|uniref:DUF676 domain-containing protein n=1 Tax=Galerina marginata (strain CBS 339.88) TaxID=685588 RepID=A0A067TNU1_GALM3|nr:hypothetical protein GALMADRAFT_111021 [Galerina marginata CBS 339.88]